MRSDTGAGRQPAPRTVDPDPAHAESLRRVDIELEMIPDHPRLLRTHAKGLQRMPVHDLVGLSRAKLALDHHGTEKWGQTVGLDLPALLARIAIRDQRKRDAARTPLLKTCERLGKQLHPAAPPLGEVPSNRLRSGLIGNAAALERMSGNACPCPKHVRPLMPVPPRIAPEPHAG